MNTIKKHSVLVFGHQTSVTMEDAFWQELKSIAARKNISMCKLIENIDAERTENLASSLRVFVLNELKNKS